MEPLAYKRTDKRTNKQTNKQTSKRTEQPTGYPRVGPRVGLRVGYLVVLLLGYGFAGWLLAAFQVPELVWVGSLAATLHLVWAETAALVLSWSWVVGLIAIAAITKAWVAVWNAHLPVEQAQLWAQGLLLIWLGASLLVLLLAYAPLPRLLRPRLGLTGLIWSALGLGAWCYQLAIWKR
ncbi:MAG: hypothetical protein ACKO7W_14360 [Elainella sp.]